MSQDYHSKLFLCFDRVVISNVIFILDQNVKLNHEVFKEVKTTVSTRRSQTANNELQTERERDQKLYATNLKGAENADKTTNARNNKK